VNTESNIPAIRPLIISAPFGNYIQPPGTTATLGTFTAARRGGILNRVWRILLTVRYYPKAKAWVNKIGLRNPGIDWLVAKCSAGTIDVADKLVSIHGFTADDWYALLDKTAPLKPLAIELNMSCPNVGHIAWPEDLFKRAHDTGVPIIIKIPPVNYDTMVEQAYAAGLRMLHCCNTLPNPGGGMSGKPLMAVALQCIQDLRRKPYFDELTLIGGGGIYNPEDIDAYADLGVKYAAIGTKVMNPKYLLSHAGIDAIKARAEQRLGTLSE
jgi:dihydroorotate dehydrogenase